MIPHEQSHPSVPIGMLRKGDAFIRRGSHPTWRNPWRIIDVYGERFHVEKIETGATNSLNRATIVVPVKVDYE